MMQATDLGKGDNLPPAGRLDRPSHGSVLTQREVRARAMVIVDVPIRLKQVARPLVAHSDAKRPLIPIQNGHRFRSKTATPIGPMIDVVG